LHKHTGIFDGLRGYMALWVLAGHCAALAGVGVPIISSPVLAVDIFMLISGFLMAWNYLRRESTEPWTSWSTIRAFYIRRFWRISPLYYAVLVPVLLVGSPLHAIVERAVAARFGQAAPITPLVPPTVDAVAHFSYAFGLFPSTASNNLLPDWSLSLEVQFYLVFPFLMLFIRRYGAFAIAAVTLAVFFAGSRYMGVGWEVAGHKPLIYPQPSVLLLKLPFFVAGMLAALAFANKDRRPDPLLVFAAGALVSYQQGIITLAIIGAVMLALFDDAALPAGMRRFRSVIAFALSCGVGRFFGRLSYGIYLLHPIFLALLIEQVGGAGWYEGARPLVRFGILLVPILLVTLLAATAAHVLIEEPGIRLGHWLAKRRTVTSGAKSAEISP
jgi:peptidoglycan/LPS O-acetylase OafA/YrhL